MRRLDEIEIADVLKVMFDFGAFGTKTDFAVFLNAGSEVQVWRWMNGETKPQDYSLNMDLVVALMDDLYGRYKASDVAVESLLKILEEHGFDVTEYHGRVCDSSLREETAADEQNRRVFDRVVAQMSDAAFKNRRRGRKRAAEAVPETPEKKACGPARPPAAVGPAGLCLKDLRAVLEDAGMWLADSTEFPRRLLPSTLLYAVPEVETDAAVMEGIHSPQLRQKIFEKLAHDSRLTVRDLIKRSNALLRELDRDRYLSGAERLLEALGTETAGLLRLKRCHQICGSRSDGSGLAVLVVFALLGEALFVRLVKSDWDFDFFNA